MASACEGWKMCQRQPGSAALPSEARRWSASLQPTCSSVRMTWDQCYTYFKNIFAKNLKNLQKGS
jgi:hypothetical protein